MLWLASLLVSQVTIQNLALQIFKMHVLNIGIKTKG